MTVSSILVMRLDGFLHLIAEELKPPSQGQGFRLILVTLVTIVVGINSRKSNATKTHIGLRNARKALHKT